MRKLKNILFILIPLLFLTGLCIFSLVSGRIPKNAPGTVGNTAGNLNNGGLFCEDDGVVYFANPYDGNTLYSMSPDETNVKKLTNASASSLNAAGEYLYFYQDSANASAQSFASIFRLNGIYRCKKNGKDAICLTRALSPALSLWENTIYYQSFDNQSGMSLCRIGTNKEDPQTIDTSIINPAAIQDGKIYYGGTSDNHFLHTLDAVTGSMATVYEGDVYNPVVVGDYVYYMDISSDYKLCRYSLSGQTAEILTQDRLDFFNVAGDMIYYQKSDPQEPALKRIHTDGSGEETVMPGVFEHISATSQYVYFNAYDAPTPLYHTPVTGAVQVGVFTPMEER